MKSGEHVASDNFLSIKECYYLDLKCYGVLNPALGDAENQQQLSKFKVTKVIILSMNTKWQKPEYLKNYHQVNGVGSPVRVLSISQ